jgi:hypothetical protein
MTALLNPFFGQLDVRPFQIDLQGRAAHTSGSALRSHTVKGDSTSRKWHTRKFKLFVVNFVTVPWGMKVEKGNDAAARHGHPLIMGSGAVVSVCEKGKLNTYTHLTSMSLNRLQRRTDSFHRLGWKTTYEDNPAQKCQST